MNEFKKLELFRIIKCIGKVTVDVVPHNGNDPYAIEFDHYEFAKSEIEGLMNENEVYF